MMPDDEDTDRVADDAKKKMVRESVEIDSTKIALADGK